MLNGRLFFRSIAMAALLVTPACDKPAPGSATATGRSGTHIVATTNIVADLVRNVVGDAYTVEALMGPGIDPHLYKASHGDVQRLQAADVVVYNGLHLEGKMVEVLASLNGKGKRTIALADGIPPERLLTVPGQAGTHDPHLWMDVELWQQAATYLARELGGEAMAQASQSYQLDLAELHGYVQSRAETLPRERRIMITAHDAFGYFGRAYGFEVRGLLGVSTASEAGTADVSALAEFIALMRVPAIFVESTVSDRYLKALQDAAASRGHQVAIGGQLFSDALGDPDGPGGTYVKMIRHNVDTIVSALSQ